MRRFGYVDGVRGKGFALKAGCRSLGRGNCVGLPTRRGEALRQRKTNKTASNDQDRLGHRAWYDEPGGCAPPKRVGEPFLVCSFMKRAERAGLSVLPSNARISLDIAATRHHILADFHDFREKGHSNGRILVDRHFVLPRDSEPELLRTAESGSDCLPFVCALLPVTGGISRTLP